MVTVFEVTILCQFVKSLVFDAPASMARIVSQPQSIPFEFFAGHPEPLALLRFSALDAAPDPVFGPLFLRADDANRFAISFAEIQILHFPKLDLPISRLILKSQAGRLALAELHGLLIGFHALLLEHDHPKPA